MKKKQSKKESGMANLTDSELEILERKYFDILSELLSRNIGTIITQIYSQNFIKSAATGNVTNVIESAAENILEGLIANQLHWNVCSLPVSSDSCFECGDAIIHIDVKTIAEKDSDNTYNKVNVEAAQTSYCKGTPLTVSGKPWEPKLNFYEEHTIFGLIPNLTFIVKIVYSATNSVEIIKLISLPHGQLQDSFGGADILGAGRNSGGTTRGNIRFKEEDILAVEDWRVKNIFTRHPI